MALYQRFGLNYRWLATFTSMLGSFATLLTATIINVAIPDVMGAFGMNQDQAQWLATGFLASNTVTMLLSAWAIESFGMARTFNVSMLIFTIGSILGGMANSSEMIIFSRVIQGAGAGLITPISMLIIFQVFPVHRRGSAMGIYSVGVVLAPALGPALGGWLIDHYSWRYVFYVAIPFALATIPLVALFMPEREADAQDVRFDWTGVILLSLFLVSLLTTLSNIDKEGLYSDFIALASFISLTSLAAFLCWELHTQDPMFNLSLFRNPKFLAAGVVTVVMGAGLYGSTYLFPLFLQIVQRLTPTDAGKLMIPAGLFMAIAFPIAGRLSDAVRPRNLILLGLAVFALSSWLYAGVDANTPIFSLILWMTIGRIGLALIFPSLNVTALRPLPLQLLAQGSGIINFLRQVGGAFGVNALSIFLQQRTGFHTAALSETQTPDNSTTMTLLAQAHSALIHNGIAEPFAGIQGFHLLGSIVYAQGITHAFRDSFLLVALVFVFCLIPGSFMDNRAPVRQ